MVSSLNQSKVAGLTWFLISILSGLEGVCSQQRNTNLVWSGQHVHAGRFNVHTFDVFSGANRLTLKIKGTSLDQVERVDVWLRHGAVPTSEDHHSHTFLKEKTREEVTLQVDSPMQGQWYVALAPSNNKSPLSVPALEHTVHRFIPYRGDARYNVRVLASGCERGRFGWPKCDSNWMRLSWGKQAEFHGVIEQGKDVWTCSMYEVAPYTSSVKFDLLSPAGKQSLKHASPQVYARFGAYPTATEFDASTAVGGLQWRPTVSVSLPKSGTWYVCAHVQRLLHVQSLDVAISVAAEVLPHTECVEHNLVSKDGQSVKHVTKCTDEVVKLELHYHSSSSANGVDAIPLPHFLVPALPRGGLLGLHEGDLRYFSFVVDPSLAGFSLRILLQSTSASSSAVAYLRQDALPETSEYDLRSEMKGGVLDWSVRFPAAGQWYLGIFSEQSIHFRLNMQVESCPRDCSGHGECQLQNEGSGLVVGTCECTFGFDGEACERAAASVSATAYYGSLLLALLAPTVALPAAFYALYDNRLLESFLLLAASASGLGCELATLLALPVFTTTARSAVTTDAALTLAVVLASIVSAANLEERVSSAAMLVTTCMCLLSCSWVPALASSPSLALFAVVLAFPIVIAGRLFAPSSSPKQAPASRTLGSQDLLSVSGVQLPTFLVGIALGVVAFACAGNLSNANYVYMHAFWRILMYLSAFAFLLSRSTSTDGEELSERRALKGGEARGEGEGEGGTVPLDSATRTHTQFV